MPDVPGSPDAQERLITIHLQECQRMLAEAMAAALECQYQTCLALGDAAPIGEDSASAVILLGEHVQIPAADVSSLRPPLLMMGERQTDLLIAHCATVHADGCVLMDTAGFTELIAAIEGVQRGEWVYPHSMRLRMMEVIAAHRTAPSHDACPLSQQEQRVLAFLVEEPGIANKQIAKRLGISIYTAKNHMHSILEKLDVEDRHRARDLALKHRWFSHSKT